MQVNPLACVHPLAPKRPIEDIDACEILAQTRTGIIADLITFKGVMSYLQRTQSSGFLEDCACGVAEVKVLPLQTYDHVRSRTAQVLNLRRVRSVLILSTVHRPFVFTRYGSNLPFVDGTQLERAIAGLVAYKIIGKEYMYCIY